MRHLSLLSIVVTKHHDQKEIGEERNCLANMSQSQFVFEGRQGGTQAKTNGETGMEKDSLPACSLSMLSCILAHLRAICPRKALPTIV